MKRFWIGVAVLLVLFIMGIALTASFSAIHTPLAETLSQAALSAKTGDLETATSAIRQAQQQWESYRRFSAAVLDHRLLEEMEELFAQLEFTKNPYVLAALCARLSSRAAEMAESQAITWWNLL